MFVVTGETAADCHRETAQAFCPESKTGKTKQNPQNTQGWDISLLQFIFLLLVQQDLSRTRAQHHCPGKEKVYGVCEGEVEKQNNGTNSEGDERRHKN